MTRNRLEVVIGERFETPEVILHCPRVPRLGLGTAGCVLATSSCRADWAILYAGWYVGMYTSFVPVRKTAGTYSLLLTGSPGLGDSKLDRLLERGQVG